MRSVQRDREHEERCRCCSESRTGSASSSEPRNIDPGGGPRQGRAATRPRARSTLADVYRRLADAAPPPRSSTATPWSPPTGAWATTNTSRVFHAARPAQGSLNEAAERAAEAPQPAHRSSAVAHASRPLRSWSDARLDEQRHGGQPARRHLALEPAAAPRGMVLAQIRVNADCRLGRPTERRLAGPVASGA